MVVNQSTLTQDAQHSDVTPLWYREPATCWEEALPIDTHSKLLPAPAQIDQLVTENR